MLEQILNFDLPTDCWVEFFANLNPIAREELDWELSDADYYKDRHTLQNVIDGYEQYKEQAAAFNSAKYKDMLNLCYVIDTADVIYEAGRGDYWKKVYDFLKRLFEDVPALNVEKEAFLSKEDREQVFKEAKTEDDLEALATKLAGDIDNTEELRRFTLFLRSNPNLFEIGTDVKDDRTCYTRVFKRRMVLKSVMEAIEFLLRKYEAGADPSTWRHV